MRFIKDHYDNKNDQLLFYPKISQRKAVQKGRYWKDVEVLFDEDHIEEEERILQPN